MQLFPTIIKRLLGLALRILFISFCVYIICRILSAPLPETGLIDDYGVRILIVGLLLFFAGFSIAERYGGFIVSGIGIVLFAVGGVAFIFPSFVASLFYLVLTAYSQYPVVTLVTGCLFVCSFIIYCVLIIQIRLTNWYSYIVFNRMATRTLIALGIIGSLILLLFTTGTAIGSKETFVIFGKYRLDNNLSMVAYLALSYWIIFGVVAIIDVVRDAHFLVYDRKNYVLFLRSFTFDEKAQQQHQILGDIKMPILKIGNPKTIWPKRIGEVFYLPSSHWKKHLDYYISRAKYVVVVVDATEGVLWEMFSHEAQWRKFVFYISSKDMLKKIVEERRYAPYANTALMLCLEHILNDSTIKDGCAFYMWNGLCYYSSSVPEIMDILMKGQTGSTSSFCIGSYGQETTTIADGVAEDAFFSVMDKHGQNIRSIKGILSKWKLHLETPLLVLRIACGCAYLITSVIYIPASIISLISFVKENGIFTVDGYSFKNHIPETGLRLIPIILLAAFFVPILNMVRDCCKVVHYKFKKKKKKNHSR